MFGWRLHEPLLQPFRFETVVMNASDTSDQCAAAQQSTCKALWHIARERVEAQFTGISRGTERLVSQGAVPESEWSVMRAPFQDGDFPFPVKYGYSAAGIVVEGPKYLLGRSVFCLFPHQEQFVVPVDAVVPIPSPFRRAAQPSLPTWRRP